MPHISQKSTSNLEDRITHIAQMRPIGTCHIFHHQSVYLLGIPVSPAKTEEPIEMPFRGRLVWAQGTMY